MGARDGHRRDGRPEDEFPERFGLLLGLLTPLAACAVTAAMIDA
jgi:hypothetical protein